MCLPIEPSFDDRETFVGLVQYLGRTFLSRYQLVYSGWLPFRAINKLSSSRVRLGKVLIRKIYASELELDFAAHLLNEPSSNLTELDSNKFASARNI